MPETNAENVNAVYDGYLKIKCSNPAPHPNNVPSKKIHP
jgi:hypothetical protein